MTVKKLIEALQSMPQEARVFYLWDGFPRSEANIVYQSKKGHIVISEYDEYCNQNNTRPIDAPEESEEKYYSLPSHPDGSEVYQDLSLAENYWDV